MTIEGYQVMNLFEEWGDPISPGAAFHIGFAGDIENINTEWLHMGLPDAPVMSSKLIFFFRYVSKPEWYPHNF